MTKNFLNIKSNSTVAAFDFDHTLTTQDSLLPFLQKKEGILKTWIKLASLSPYFSAFLLRLLSRQQIKEKILTTFFKGIPFHQLQMLAQCYAEHQLDRLLRPEALARLQWHQEQKHCCILISASLEIYLTPWAQRHRFQAVLASRLEVTNKGIVTGKLEGINCWGAEKRRRLAELLGPKENYKLYAYGDSHGDAELLAMADYPFYQTFSE